MFIIFSNLLKMGQVNNITAIFAPTNDKLTCNLLNILNTGKCHFCLE